MNKKAKDKILKIKKQILKECGSGFVPEWFFNGHLVVVEKFCNFLMKKLPKADKEVVLLIVWLHDLQRIRGLNGDHQKIGAVEAEKVMKDFAYGKEIIKKVKDAILSHSCNNILPKTLEGKIIATADAMSHYVNDFYLQIALARQRNLKEMKEWALEKLERDYNNKIFFDFAREKIRERHKALKNFFTMS